MKDLERSFSDFSSLPFPCPPASFRGLFPRAGLVFHIPQFPPVSPCLRAFAATSVLGHLEQCVLWVNTHRVELGVWVRV